MQSRLPLYRWAKLLFLLVLAACNMQTTTPTPAEKVPTPLQPEVQASSGDLSTPFATPDVLSQGIGPNNFPADINPLTGMPVDEPERLAHRPVAIKVSNYPRSNRPQWGLSLADIVYEYYHNNDLTRFYAVFYGQDASLVGPIRSARLFDDYLVESYKSEFVYASADFRIRERLQDNYPSWRLLFLLEGDCPPRPVCRYLPDTFNYLVANTREVGDYIEQVGGDNSRQTLNGMSFGPVAGTDGESAVQIYVRYSYSAYTYWDFDPDKGRYLRYQDTQEDVGGRGEGYEALTDRLTGEPIAADNVVVLYVPHFHFFYQAATNTTPAVEVVDMDFTGRGPAVAFRDGQAFELEWVNEDGQVLYLINERGERFLFKPGNTWFQVLNTGSGIENGEGIWRFDFRFRQP